MSSGSPLEADLLNDTFLLDLFMQLVMETHCGVLQTVVFICHTNMVYDTTGD